MQQNSKHIVRKIALLIFLFSTVFSFSLKAQNYPVQANVYLVPPYGNYLSDYHTGSKEKLVLTLLNRDQQRPKLEVYLRLQIKASNGLSMQSREEQVYPIIQLDAGIPHRLSQEDLSPYFQQLSTQGYMEQGRLPDGLVEFSFQVLDSYSKRPLSAVATGRAYLSAQKPPFLRLPSNNEEIAFRDPISIQFKWEPQHRNISQIEYEFEVRELPDYGAVAQSAFLYAPIIYQERLNYSYLHYDLMKPLLEPNKQYAWRVRAIAKDGIDELNLFDNNGYSEIYAFRTRSNCQPPSNCKAELQSRRLDLSWLPGEGNNEFVVQYRPKHGTAADWSEANSFQNSISLHSLSIGTTYEYRVGAICTSGNPVFSTVGEISIPLIDSTRLANCGIQPSIDISNKEPLEELRIGDIIHVSDFPVTLTQISGSAGTFTGEGWIPINWRPFESKWAVEFSNIKINTDRQVIEGSVRAKYDAKESQIAQIDDIIEGGIENTLHGITRTDVQVDFLIPENPNFSYNEESEELVLYSTDGQKKIGTISLQKNEGKAVFPLTIEDKEGNMYRVEEEQNADTEENKTTPGSKKIKSSFLGKKASPLAANSFSKKKLSHNFPIISFRKGEGVYAFDKFIPGYEKINLIVKHYSYLIGKKDKKQYIPWKWLPVGGDDSVEAYFEKGFKLKNKTDFDPEKVIFSTPQGTQYSYHYDNKAESYSLRLVGGEEGDVQEVFALYPQGDKYETLGQLNIVSYPKQRHKLVLVQVNGNKIDQQEAEAMLAEVYNPVGVSWEVELMDFNYPEQELKEFFKEGAKSLQKYNPKMSALQQEFQRSIDNYDRKTVYVFVLNESSGGSKRDLAGFMPRGEQFGYIFTGKSQSIYTTLAHELGHGRWKLKHPFDKSYGKKTLKEGDTDNLMDYKGGTQLAKWQWGQINDPAWFAAADGEERGMAFGEKGTSFYCISDNLALESLNRKYRHFYLPDGRVIDTEGKYKVSGFFSKNDVTKDARGAIYSFIIGNYDFIHIYQKDSTLGYGYSDAEGKAVTKIPSNLLKQIDEKTKAVRIYLTEIKTEKYQLEVYQQGIKIDSIPVNSCGCVKNYAENLKPKRFRIDDDIDKSYLENAKKNGTKIIGSIANEQHVIETLLEEVKKQRNTIDAKPDILGEILIDKFKTYEIYNNRRLIVIYKALDTYSENQESWNLLAQEVFRQANLGENDILITLPYVVVEGILKHDSRILFMPGYAKGDKLEINEKVIGENYNSAYKSAAILAGNKSIVNFAADIFKSIYKKHSLRKAFICYNGDLIENVFLNDNVSGKGYNFEFQLSVDKRLEKYLRASYQDCINSSKKSNQSFVSSFFEANPNIDESQLVEHGLNEFNGTREEEVCRKYINWYKGDCYDKYHRNHNINEYIAPQVEGCETTVYGYKNSTLSIPDECFYGGLNKVIYNQRLAGLDALGIFLSTVGLDAIADGIGLLYATYHGVHEDIVVYGASFVIPAVSGSAVRLSKNTLKELKIGKKIFVRDATTGTFHIVDNVNYRPKVRASNQVAKGTNKALPPKVEQLVKNIEELYPRNPEVKKAARAFLGELDPHIIEQLADIPGFDKALKGLSEQWKTFHGEKFVIEDIQKSGSKFINEIESFEAIINDEIGSYTADIMLKSGKGIEYKSWKKSTYSLMNGEQFNKQLNANLGSGNFEYRFNSDKLIKDKVENPEIFVKEKIRNQLKKNANEWFNIDNKGKQTLKEEIIFNYFETTNLDEILKKLDNLDSKIYKNIKMR